MKPTKSHYFLTCWNCARLTVGQNPVDLTMLENSCENFPCPGKRCEWWNRKRFDKKV